MGTSSFKLRRAFTFFGLVASIGSVSLVTATGCGDSGGASTSSGAGGGNDCVGGVIVDGKCEGKCDPSLCVADNTCYGNRCVLECTTVQDCIVGQQECQAITDDSGAKVQACIYTTKSPMAGVPCPLGTECAGASACPDGSPCGDGVMDPKCSGASCRPLTCLSGGVGDTTAYCTTFDCTKDTDCTVGMQCDTVRSGHPKCEGTCGNGKLEGGEDCDGTQLGGLTCSKLSLGTGTLACKSDCTFDTTGCAKHFDDPACIPPSDFTADGATYSEGPIGLERNICKKRSQCDACTTDLDCSATSGQNCVMVGGEGRCATVCNGAGDCNLDSSCTDGHCVPKFGKCVGDGKFCEPCTGDLDCKAGGKDSVCLTLLGDDKQCISYASASDGSLVPEATCGGKCVNCPAMCKNGATCTKASDCIGGDCDTTNSVCMNCGACTSCTMPCTGEACTGKCSQAGANVNFPPFCKGNDTDCPTSPGGKHGTCLDETLEVSPTDASYFHCTFPTSTKTLKASCY